ncbi:leucyl aminopeptidase [Auritidibacter ignavus]|uniref:leucyl aminopeptidase n=1 Tax=Auritidibacter ignavus TaxID=678932 RepID=UPI0016ABC6E1|nr:leucyl aminopeptidase [Auritidibacter ignavus]NIH70398.1 leucyl aminopeptidase [Auritidibacter ignavus]WGH82322.1 leucyl aminopeptidase [Auritidibacter ignavus]
MNHREVMSLTEITELMSKFCAEPHLRYATVAPEADLVIYGVAVGEESGTLVASDAPESLHRLLSDFHVTGAAEKVLVFPAPEDVAARKIAFVGLGSAKPAPQGTPVPDQRTPDTLGPESYRRAAGAAVRHLLDQHPVSTVVFEMGADSPELLQAVAEGAAIASYRFTAFSTRTSNDETPHDATGQRQDRLVADEFVIRTAVEEEQAERIVTEASQISRGVHTVMNLVNTPASVLYPESFAEFVTQLVSDQPQIRCEIWDEQQLHAEGCGGILGIGQGSAHPPRLVRLSYQPATDSHVQPTHVALVGKGITFDTGGISLKPANSMLTMKTDMTGAATVAAVINTVAALNLPIKVTGWLAMAENMPSSTAVKPSDIVTIRNGKTVEIMNTDAEGRVVMADALVAATEEAPAAVIDIATLTGAQMVALGQRTTGVMGHDQVRTQLVEAAQRAGELIWPMPIPENQRESLDSRVADISNMGSKFGGMLTAAAFLRDFVGETPWAHLDIAGPSFNEEAPFGYTPKDATGVMLRTLVEYLRQNAQQS